MLKPLCTYLQYNVMSGLSDALLRLGAVLPGQWDGRLVQAPVLLALQLQNKDLHNGGTKALRTDSHVSYTLTMNIMTNHFKYPH